MKWRDSGEILNLQGRGMELARARQASFLAGIQTVRFQGE
jgi:hypothetical protein